MLDLVVMSFNLCHSGTILPSFLEFCDINTFEKIIEQLFCREFLNLSLSGISS